MTAKSEALAQRVSRAALRRTTLAATLLLLLAGCQTAPQDLSTDRAEQFQARVLAITTAVSDGSYAGALDELAALEADLNAAAADGTISFSRHQRIEAALSAVKADVQAAVDAEVAPAPAETPTPAPEEDEPDTGNGNGPGKDNGNGPGKDNGNEKKGKPTKPKG